MEDEEFKKLVELAVETLPKEFLEKLENVGVVTQDWPSRYQMQKLGTRGKRGLLLGLYEGVPQTKRGRYGIGGPLPDKITIFKMPLLMISETYEALIKNVKNTVIHEIAHHFGLSEEAIGKAKNADKDEH
jgi:predicted Zn-dependent protease with MMP-like domain